jgi:glycosyltransferase involved in cell wall biosynthesis
VPRRRIRIAVEAPAAEFRPSESEAAIESMARRVGVPAGATWFVYVGGFNPHKRVDLLVRAHAALAVELGARAPHLILVGSAERDGFHKDVETIRNAIEAANTESLVHWPGFVTDADLRHLYSGALALVLPSECEGFGLPAVEAAACGSAVIATTESPLPVLLAGGGVFVQPGDVGQLTTAMHTIATDEPARRSMGARARERANQLTWQRSARAVLAALREAAAGGVRPIPLGASRGRLEHAEIAG